MVLFLGTFHLSNTKMLLASKIYNWAIRWRTKNWDLLANNKATLQHLNSNLSVKHQFFICLESKWLIPDPMLYVHWCKWFGIDKFLSKLVKVPLPFNYDIKFWGSQSKFALISPPQKMKQIPCGWFNVVNHCFINHKEIEKSFMYSP